MKNWIATGLTLLSLHGLAEVREIAPETLKEILSYHEIEKTKDKTPADSFKKTLPGAISDTLLLELPLDILSYGLGIGPNPADITIRALATVGGYSIRKTCKDYQSIDGVVHWSDAGWCGIAGGALKYGTRSAVLGKYNYLEPFVGAIDAGLYDATSHLRGSFPTAEYVVIETFVAGIQNLQAYWLAKHALGENLGKDLRAGAAVGVLVSGFVHTTISWYSDWLTQMLKNATTNEIKPDANQPT